MAPNSGRELSVLPSRTTLLSMQNQTPNSHRPLKSRRKQTLLKLRYVALVIVIGWVAYEFFHVQAPELNRLRKQNAQLQSQLSDLEKQKSDLQNQIQNLQSDKYIEKYATTHFGLILPGQVPFDMGH